MRITEIESHNVFIPFQDFNAKSLSRYHGRSVQARTIFVVRTDNGLEGLGEQWGPASDVDQLCSRYIGTDPFDWVGDDFSLPMNMALYDLMGKQLGLPVWKLFGPKVRSWIPVAAWTVSQAPDVMAEEVRQAASRGYHWMKYHVGEVQNVIDQTEAMQKAAPGGFKIHYDFNANSNVYTMGPILKQLEGFSLAGRFEDIITALDEDGYRLLREKCRLPVIVHHGPTEFMIKGLCDGFMAGHAPVGMAFKCAAVAEMTQTPIMYQQAGGHINQAFLAHEAAVVKMATIDHVNLCHLWKDDVTVETMPVVNGNVRVPEGPGLGVTLDRRKLERYAAAAPHDKGRFLVRVRYENGLTVYVRHDPDAPASQDHLRYNETLYGSNAPGPPASYVNPVVTDYWEPDDDPASFAQIWERTESGPYWTEGEKPIGGTC